MRHSYDNWNFCAICVVWYAKKITNCFKCGNKLRTKPHNKKWQLEPPRM